jgi:hypothetical protein
MMKKLTIALMLLALAGCQTSDSEIRADIAGKAQENLYFAGLQYTVNKGIVTFTGNVPSEKALTKVRQTIEGINVIKDVRYQIAISPVVLDTLTPIKLQIDSLLANYPLVNANVNSAGITLKGEIAAAERTKLMEAIKLPHVSLVKDSLTIR